MTNRYRDEAEGLLDGSWARADHGDVPAGKRSLTQGLSARPIVFRVESAEAARELGAAFGRRDGNGVAEGAEARVDRAASGSGEPLRADVRDRFETSLGADLSSVRVHRSAASAEASAAVGAKAYTVGNDIHFAAGQYQPDDPFGMHLLAHEVAHTQQQAGGSARRQHKLEVSAPGDHAEVEADRAADAMVAGAPAVVDSSARALGRAPAEPAPANGPGKATVEVEAMNDGPFKLTISTSTDTEGNREITVAGSVTAGFGPFPIGASPFSWKAEVGGKVSGTLAAKKGEDIGAISLSAQASGALTIHGGIPHVGTAFGGGELTVGAPVISLSKGAGGWSGKLMGPIALGVAPIVGIESEPLGAKYQVDIIQIALAEIHSFSPLNVKPGASLVALGKKLNDIVGKINAALIIVGAKDMPTLKRVGAGGMPGLTAFIAAAKKKEAAATEARHTKQNAEYNEEHNPNAQRSSQNPDDLAELDRCEPPA